MSYNPYSLNGKIILVTGASSGIGSKTAEILDQLGARLILVGRNQELLEQRKLKLSSDKNHIIAPFDLNCTDKIKDWLTDLVSTNSIKLDGAVHAAGIQKVIPLRMHQLDHYEEIMRINFYSGVAILQSMVSKKVSNSSFSYVFISSVMGSVGQSGVSGYSSSKGAVNSFVKSAALEMSRNNARVNAVAPGFVVSEMSDKLFSLLSEEQQKNIINYHPLGVGTSKDVAYGVAYLLSDAAKWITGTVLTIDGGYTCH
ncbi:MULTISPECIES: SDR family NAD(P)-dependent oxidoreductase [Paenibacillus]|uniref:SDR family NAD(P)-dependent oxidoreductase n=1 Tax=Paenibacillus TaxID=44249 RepID=UPI0015E12F1C|nr:MULTISPECIES: SDR family oxidoreductase [Paenibacillus]MDY7991536.1 SDR family oxidoreductase [Paenibacillus polymyxa]